MSQLDLAGAAGISSRHLSFLETGRAHPSREMVHLIAATLDLSLDDENALHLAAGFVAPHGDRGLETADFQHVHQALDFILAQQEPFPAIVIDGRWDVRMRNGAARRLFAPFHEAYDMPERLRDNAMHTVFHPGGLRQFFVNWDEFAGHLIRVLHREASQGSHSAAALREEILAYPGIAPAWRSPLDRSPSQPVMTMQLRRGTYALSFFSTLTTFAMPREVALQQLKIEGFYAADDATAATARHLASSATPPTHGA
jgi:transcriptional regulator with XRE-family HTH domain